MVTSYKTLDSIEHRFKGYFEISSWKRHNPRNSIQWWGRRSAASGFEVIIDSVRTEGQFGKKDRRRLYLVEKWLLKYFGEYAWSSVYPINNVRKKSCTGYTDRSMSDLFLSIVGKWPTAYASSYQGPLCFLDSSVILSSNIVITDESYSGNWAIPYCLKFYSIPGLNINGARFTPREICFDRSKGRAMKSSGSYSKGRTYLYHCFETRPHREGILGDHVIINGHVPIDLWRSETFSFTIFFEPLK